MARIRDASEAGLSPRAPDGGPACRLPDGLGDAAGAARGPASAAPARGAAAPGCRGLHAPPVGIMSVILRRAAAPRHAAADGPAVPASSNDAPLRWAERLFLGFAFLVLQGAFVGMASSDETA